MNRIKTFAVAIVYLIVILVLGLIYYVKPEWLSFLLPPFKSPGDPVRYFGSIPLGVPWFGALGAVLISLTGIFDHEHDWDEGMWPWHLARPLIGAGLGIVSVLIFQAGILAVGSTPQGKDVPKNFLYYLVAFAVGYREQTFRELMKRLLDVILAPGGAAPAAKPTINGINPAQAPHGTSTQVVITGAGLTGTQSVKFGDTAAAQVTPNSDTQLTVMTPVVAAAGAVTITVTTKGGSATFPFTFA